MKEKHSENMDKNPKNNLSCKSILHSYWFVF